MPLAGTRSFSAPFIAIFRNGVASVKEGIFVKLNLMAGEFSEWGDQPDAHFYLYQVVGDFSPPLAEDTFGRLDDHYTEVRTAQQMEAEEALVGLRLVHSGTVPILTLISNRSRLRMPNDTMLNDSDLPPQEDLPETFHIMRNQAYGAINCNVMKTVTQCTLDPHKLESSTTDAHSPTSMSTQEAIELSVVSEACRVLDPASR
jgi:hypothetical protein